MQDLILYAEYVVSTEARNYQKCCYNRRFLIICLTGSSVTSSVEPLASPRVHRFNPRSFNTTQRRFDSIQRYKNTDFFFVAAFRRIFLKRVTYPLPYLLLLTRTINTDFFQKVTTIHVTLLYSRRQNKVPITNSKSRYKVVTKPLSKFLKRATSRIKLPITPRKVAVKSP